jgi:hypothetical protein
MFTDSSVPIEAPKRVEIERGFVRAANGLSTVFTLGDLEEQAYRALDNMEEGEDLEAQIALIDQMMVEKVEGYVSVIRNLERMAEARKLEADRLRDRAKTAEKAADWLKARLLTHMQVTGRQRMEMARFTLTVRQNNPHAEILNEPETSTVTAYETMPGVPPEFVRLITLYKVDKRAILAHVKATGEVLDGVEVSRTERLDIR